MVHARTPFFLRITYIDQHRTIVQFESIQFPKSANIPIPRLSGVTTVLLHLRKVRTIRNRHSPFTLQSGTIARKSKRDPNPPPISPCSTTVIVGRQAKKSGRRRTNSRNKPEELVVIRGFWIKAVGEGARR